MSTINVDEDDHPSMKSQRLCTSMVTRLSQVGVVVCTVQYSVQHSEQLDGVVVCTVQYSTAYSTVNNNKEV